MKLLAINQRGDTIVEVLIAVIIVSTVLAGAYISSNQSLTSNRQSQERGEATKYAEAQAERLKIAAPTNAGIFNPSGNVFCLDGSNNPVTATTTAYTSGSFPSLDTDPLAYTPSCVSGRYNQAIEYDQPNNVFRIHVRLEKAGGNGRDEVLLTYRVNQ